MPRRVRTTFSAVGLRLVVGCFVLFGLTMLGLGPGMVSAADATPATTSPSSEQTLADRYAPIVVVRQQSTPCGDGEPYLPVSVSAVLGRPGVTLRGPDGQVVKSAPTAADLAGKGEGFYLDYPGSPLSPGCDYEKWFRSTGTAAAPTLYAHVATDPAHPGMLALQYWFFYVYNDWNDKHEGDWEMVQLLFDAPSVDQALTQSPVSVAFAQHEGSEVSAWDDPKLHKNGDHIAVYPGQGSHAAYYTQAEWFGKSAAAGFGCDNTAAPGVAVTPAVVVVPSGTNLSTGDFAWLTFTGRWGQKAPSFNNGPTGPNTKTQWTAPISWQLDEGRDSATALPIVAGPAANAFCALSGGGSLLFLQVLDTPALVIGSLIGLIVIVVLVWKSTRWRGSTSQPVDQERRAGQMVFCAFDVVRRHFLTFALIGAGVLVAVVLSVWWQSLLLRPVETTNVARVGAPRWDWLVFPAAVIPLVVVLPVIALVVAACQQVVAAEADGRDCGPRQAFGEVLRRPAGAIAFLVMYLLVGVCASTILLIPVALWLVSRWAVGSSAAIFENLNARAGLRRSAQLTAGHRWRTIATSGLLFVIGVSVGPLIGGLLLLPTPLPFLVSNGIAAVVSALLIPVASVGVALQFLDLRRRHEVTEPAEPVLVD